MIELVDREEVIKTVDKLLPADTLSKEYEAVFHMLGELYKIPVVKRAQWIPCSERLPEENEFVLVTFGWFGRADDLAVNIDYRRDGDWAISELVTAWMPLPEPYGGENE